MAFKHKTYFVSDFHLGIMEGDESIEHEKEIVRWLTSIQSDAKALYLVGDVFDYWFEYKEVVPKGFLRFLGKLAELSDDGVEISFFAGNHDMWAKDYFQTQIKADYYSDHLMKNIEGKEFFIHHGDGLEKGTSFYKFVKANIYRSRMWQFLYRYAVHPDIGLLVAKGFSKKSRHSQKERNISTVKQYIFSVCKEILKTHKIDYFIFGHNHLPFCDSIPETNSYVFSLGDWINKKGVYAVFDGTDLQLKTFAS